MYSNGAQHSHLNTVASLMLPGTAAVQCVLLCVGTIIKTPSVCTVDHVIHVILYVKCIQGQKVKINVITWSQHL